MRIAGITWWRYNYGSILQAYALQEKINSYDGIDYEILCQYGKKVASFSNLKNKLSNVGIRVTIKRIIWKFGLKKLRQRNFKIQKFIDENLLVSDREYTEDNISESNNVYDGYVCGSDQIWNPDLVNIDSMYWLTFANPDKLKFAYAPSVGVNSFTSEQEKTIRKNLSSFNAISAREESGTKLINKAMGKDVCITVLDPTMMIERKKWDDLSKKRLYKESYIFVYMLRGTKKQRKFIEKFAAEKGLKIVTMPFLDSEKIELYDFSFGDIKLWDADPGEFISAIRYADYVFTDSFHSMVFSCLYHRDFFVFPKIGKSQINRLSNLMDMFKIKNRMLNDECTVDKITNVEKIDWDYVDLTLSERRKKSIFYLEKALSVNN